MHHFDAPAHWMLNIQQQWNIFHENLLHSLEQISQLKYKWCKMHMNFIVVLLLLLFESNWFDLLASSFSYSLYETHTHTSLPICCCLVNIHFNASERQEIFNCTVARFPYWNDNMVFHMWNILNTNTVRNIGQRQDEPRVYMDERSRERERKREMVKGRKKNKLHYTVDLTII